MSVTPEDFRIADTSTVGEGSQGDSSPSSWLLTNYVKHLSQSSFGMFRRCPFQWQRRYVHGEKERPGEGLIIGDWFHEGLGYNLVQKIESHTDRPVTEVVEWMRDVGLGQVLVNQGVEISDISWDGKPEVAMKESLDMISSYMRGVVSRVQPLGIEERFDLDVPGVPVPVIGYLDVRTEHRILDYKTGKQAVKKVKPSWMLQGTLYAAASAQPVEYHTISRTLKVNTPLESEDLLVPVPSETQREALNTSMRFMAETIEHYLRAYGPNEPWPTLGKIADWTQNSLPCNFCGWRAKCPAWSE